jgi:hypothetical protein
MAIETQIGGGDDLFVGEDKTIVLGPVVNTSGVLVDISAWNINFVVRVSDTASSTVFEKTASVTGSYNLDLLLNTQRASIVLLDTETDALKGKTYRHSWKRMDNGFETILAFGDFVVQKATAA